MEGRYCINYLNDRLDQLLVIFRYKYKLTNKPDVLSICFVCALYSSTVHLYYWYYNKNNNNKINNTVKVAKMRSVGAGGVKNSRHHKCF